MRLQLYDIVPGLKPYLKEICTMDCDEGVDTHHIRVLPDACVELFINYTDTPIAMIGHSLYKDSIITARMSRPTDVQMRKGSGCLAVCFRPGMASNFFQVPMQALTDAVVDLADIWSGVTKEIEDKMAQASTNQERVAMVQHYLGHKLSLKKEDPQLVYCLKQVQLSQGLIPLSSLTAATGLSQRHLSRKFQQHVGLSPKAYLRVSRFIRSLAHLKACPERSLTEIAYASGYYDQSHFNRDCKAYTGITPNEVANAQHILY